MPLPISPASQLRRRALGNKRGRPSVGCRGRIATNRSSTEAAPATISFTSPMKPRTSAVSQKTLPPS